MKGQIKGTAKQLTPEQVKWLGKNMNAGFNKSEKKSTKAGSNSKKKK